MFLVWIGIQTNVMFIAIVDGWGTTVEVVAFSLTYNTTGV